MQRRTVIASIGAIVGTSVGAAAYTSATVTRDATFTVKADSDARIGLGSGNLTGITYNSDADTFGITVNDLNTDGEFTFGDPDDFTNTYAFEITNNDGQEHEFTITYDSSKVQFDVSESLAEGESFPNVGTINDLETDNSVEDEGVTWTAANNATAYFVMTVDTEGVTVGTDGDGTEPNDNGLDGTLTIKASSTTT